VYLFVCDELDLSVHDLSVVSASAFAAYLFLHDNSKFVCVLSVAHTTHRSLCVLSEISMCVKCVLCAIRVHLRVLRACCEVVYAWLECVCLRVY